MMFQVDDRQNGSVFVYSSGHCRDVNRYGFISAEREPLFAIQMTNPAIQNDFSYYRRTLSRMRMTGGVSPSARGVRGASIWEKGCPAILAAVMSIRQWLTPFYF